MNKGELGLRRTKKEKEICSSELVVGLRFWNLEMFDPSIQPSVSTAGIEKSYYVNIYLLVNQVLIVVFR